MLLNTNMVLKTFDLKFKLIDEFSIAQQCLNYKDEPVPAIEIHLDDTDADNGALKVIPGSHKKGIVRPEGVGEGEVFCPVKKGAVMLMSPLLMHASNRTTNNMKRRVVHLEFSNQSLQGGLKWSEFLNWRN